MTSYPYRKKRKFLVTIWFNVFLCELKREPHHPFSPSVERNSFGLNLRIIYSVVAEITMLNDCKALLRQAQRSYFMMTLYLIESEVLYGLIHPLKRCKEQGFTADGVYF